MSVFNACHIPFFGDAHVLRIQECALPEIKKNQLLVNVVAASVNPIDFKTRAGLGWVAKEIKDNLPWVPGFDMAGIISAVGDEDNEHLMGQYVFGMIGIPFKGGAYSEYCTVEKDEVLFVPPKVDLRQAAALPLAGLTAFQALQYGKVKAGDRVLIFGATGGVGHIAAQLASIQGAKVICTGSEAKREALSALDFQWQWQDESGLVNQDFDLVVDCVGGEPAINLLNQLGQVTNVVTLPTLTADAVKQAASLKNTACFNFLVEVNNQQLQTMIDWIAEGLLQIYVAKTYGLNDVAMAHIALEEGQYAGKVLLDLG
ncbi:NADPH:quinone reductase [Saccharobesus litoralis]|uniref:NADPH:quinone reductase n=1 Tax=Saccharobesus litoralis TaxID=2172099 RepID=A0A2S0VUJ0_9ALTE|nr:NADP-dependent oxidoreductase [Saccharobesus litoralis]AWB67853.1 NADPH:quinone reductase [Saccharobesus litoralis]